MDKYDWPDNPDFCIHHIDADDCPICGGPDETGPWSWQDAAHPWREAEDQGGYLRERDL